jgi:hypothetical protein
MNLAKKTTVIAAIALWVGLLAAAQQPADLAGTWSGEATLDTTDKPDVLTLVLELKDGKLAGRMTDQYGAIDGEIKDIVLENGSFNFATSVNYASANSEGHQGTILFKMKLSGDTMKGEIEIPEMSAKGTWQATKQK